ncbi:hypothetical protein QTP88_000284 [Uroleucon formosanum]
MICCLQLQLYFIILRYFIEGYINYSIHHYLKLSTHSDSYYYRPTKSKKTKIKLLSEQHHKNNCFSAS